MEPVKMAQTKRFRYANNADNVAYYHVYKYNSLQRLNKSKSMHGVKRVIAFCILTAVLPASLIILPLYLRHTVFADVVYPIAESDIIEIRDGISSVFCQKHTLQMNSTFNAFQLDHEPEVSHNRKHIRLKKSMSLPDDTLEYWGFYLLKGATVALRVCSRYDGSRILVVKGERNLRTCGLLDHNSNKIDNYLNKEHGQVLVTFESAAEFIEYSNERKEATNLPTDENQGGEDLTEEHGAPEVSTTLLNRPNGSKDVRAEQGGGTNNELDKSKRTTTSDTTGRKVHSTTKRMGRPVSVTTKNVQLSASTSSTTTSTTTEPPTSTTESLVKKYRNFRATEAGPSAEASVDEGSTHRKRHNHNKTGHRQRLDSESLNEQGHIVPPDSVDRSGQQQQQDQTAANTKRQRRRRRRRDLVYDRAINHGGNAMNHSNNTSDSVSSFENNLLSCYDGDILLAHSFPPSKDCQSVKYLEGASHTVTKHEVVSDGYYYYIFYSDNDYVQNDIHAMFDIYKPTFQYSNISDTKACINSTQCSFPITFWSNERVIVEVPTRDGIEHEDDDITMLVSTCHPRMAIYIIFPVSVLLLVLTCAFL